MKYGNVHDVYDVILKIIINFWTNLFLQFIGIDEEVKVILKTEFETLYGKKIYLDFLCELKNGDLFHIEFEFPSARNDELIRFHFYNCIIRFFHDGDLETFVFNFSSKRKELKSEIRQSISFHPPSFNLADVNFDEYCDNINIKVKTNNKLTGIEEIILMLRCLVPSFHDKTSTLKRISKLLHKKELFDESRFQYFEAVILLEIHNIIPEKDCEEIMKEIGEIKMTPQAESAVNKAVTEINDKILYQTREEGIKEGIIKGIIKGREEGILKVASNLKGFISDEEIAKRTGLSLSEVQKL